MLEVGWESRVKLLKGEEVKPEIVCTWASFLKESPPLPHARY